jgi:hypothetical protein
MPGTSSPLLQIAADIVQPCLHLLQQRIDPGLHAGNQLIQPWLGALLGGTYPVAHTFGHLPELGPQIVKSRLDLGFKLVERVGLSMGAARGRVRTACSCTARPRTG